MGLIHGVQVNHTSQECTARPYYLTGMIERADQRFQLFPEAGTLALSFLQQGPDSVELIAGRPQLPCWSVHLYPQICQASAWAFTLVIIDRNTQLAARTIEDGHGLLTLLGTGGATIIKSSR